MVKAIQLYGCRSEPLLSYLKALGVFRLVAEQKDCQARASWHRGTFVLHSSLDERGLIDFFLNEYQPTPIIGPWAGGSGFFTTDNSKSRAAVEKILSSVSPRLQNYRQIVKQAKEILQRMGQQKKPSNSEEKERLLKMYRREMPDEFVAWMDTAIVLQNNKAAFHPLLGTGGNDGNLNFTIHFMEHLSKLGLTDANVASNAKDLLEQALLSKPVSGLSEATVGQYDPGRIGGDNAGSTGRGIPLANPWDFVLMLEGSLLMAGSVARRLSTQAAQGKAAFPFTVNAVATGNGDFSERGEIWLPIWHKPASLHELRYVFAEGRAQVGKRQAADAVDFALAVASLGVDRGLSEFVRYSFLKRNGKSYIATPIGRMVSRPQVGEANLLLEALDWLHEFREACGGEKAQPRFLAALRRLDEAVVAYCQFGGRERFGAVLRALGRCERMLALNPQKPGCVGERLVRPVPLLSSEWVRAAYEDSAEFRIALALASIRASGGVPPLRANLEPVESRGKFWNWSERSYNTVWSGDNLTRNLESVFERRLISATQAGLHTMPVEAHLPASLSDVAAFLHGHVNDLLIADWLWGLVLVDLSGVSLKEINRSYRETDGGEIPMPRAYALLKLIFLPEYQALKTLQDKPLPMEPSAFALLRSGRISESCNVAARRLRASGYVPMPGPNAARTSYTVTYRLPPTAAARITSALLIPVSPVEELVKLVLRPKDATTTSEPDSRVADFATA